MVELACTNCGLVVGEIEPAPIRFVCSFCVELREKIKYQLAGSEEKRGWKVSKEFHNAFHERYWNLQIPLMQDIHWYDLEIPQEFLTPTPPEESENGTICV